MDRTTASFPSCPFCTLASACSYHGALNCLQENESVFSALKTLLKPCLSIAQFSGGNEFASGSRNAGRNEADIAAHLFRSVPDRRCTDTVEDTFTQSVLQRKLSHSRSYRFLVKLRHLPITTCKRPQWKVCVAIIKSIMLCPFCSLASLLALIVQSTRIIAPGSCPLWQAA